MKDWPEKSIRQALAAIEGGDFVNLGSPNIPTVEDMSGKTTGGSVQAALFAKGKRETPHETRACLDAMGKREVDDG